MPLREWFSTKGHPGWYSWLVVVGTSLTSAVLTLVVSVHASQSAVNRERTARELSQKQTVAAQVEARRSACLVIISQDEAYNDPGAAPPQTAAGRRAASAWHSLRQTFQCDKKE